MRLTIVSIGKLKDAAEVRLFERYQERIDTTGRQLGFAKLGLKEFSESRAKTADLRKAAEAEHLTAVLSQHVSNVVLDERGDQMTSRAFANWLAEMRDRGTQSLAFAIGGPDGVLEDVRHRASKRLSLSRLTLPHGLARVVLAEQIYRAMTILANHPYHRD